MIYDTRKLQEKEEVSELKRLLSIYREFDKLDIIIDLTIQNLGISREEFKTRKVNGKKEKFIKINSPPEAIKFCTGDKCEIPIFMNKC